ncbi:MAG: hypothetical protein M1835_007501 [Candelina submexicana]|nr:MAG: hypothetical protein M1835_007501 [Candelina submexicana]
MKLENGSKARKSSRDGFRIRPDEQSATRSQLASNFIEPAPQWQPASVEQGTASEAVQPRRTLFSRLFPPTNAGPSAGVSRSNLPQVPRAASKSKTSTNASAVSQLSTRRFGTKRSVRDGKLPGNYKATARRVTFAMVALPIAIVTSYILYERRNELPDLIDEPVTESYTVVLGQERKRLIR